MITWQDIKNNKNQLIFSGLIISFIFFSTVLGFRQKPSTFLEENFLEFLVAFLLGWLLVSALALGLISLKYIPHQGWKRMLIILGCIGFVLGGAIELGDRGTIDIADVLEASIIGIFGFTLAVLTPQLLYGVLSWVRSGFTAEGGQNQESDRAQNLSFDGGQLLGPIIYITSAILVLAIAPWPIGYYTLLRLITTSVFIWGAIVSVKREYPALPYVFGSLALLFNPIFPVYLSKEIWIFIDFFAALILLANKRHLD